MKTLLILFVVLFAAVSPQSVIRAQLCLDPGASITVKDGTLFSAGGGLTIRSNATASGHLADQTTTGVQISGAVNIERYIAANGWHNISSPIATANTTLFGSNSLIFYYDETLVQNDWNFGWVWHNGSMESMRGYDLLLEGGAVNVQFASADPLQLHTGSYAIAVYNTTHPEGEIPERKGWNLLGNPFASPIDWLNAAGWNKAAINDVVYVWDPANDIYTAFIGGSDPIGINGATQYIPSCQGFWVQALQNGSVQVSNAARVGIATGTPDYYKKTRSVYPIIQLSVTGNTGSDETIIRFLDGATDNFDQNKDAIKLFSPNPKIPQLYTTAPNNKLAINSMGKERSSLEIPILIKGKIDEPLLLDIMTLANFEIGTEVYLKNTQTQTLIQLTEGMQIQLSQTGAFATQNLAVVINPSEAELQTQKTPFIVFFNQNGEIQVNNTTDESKYISLMLYDITGKIVAKNTFEIVSVLTWRPGTMKGIFVLVINDSGNIFTHKLFNNN
ncbi:MAG: hypothetical protein KJ578_03185 [Bacteroidetes bacterium]|nr:hypothetical protein [Bacteroidota bacterium]MBU1579767.1 hypothetical protein [Bacteroidota bacterium]MBU2465181.1 hypothetical protein [Bacteroidota bacterium]MBU2556767.1 hypothetical protein [Bacteroidota bacterium]